MEKKKISAATVRADFNDLLSVVHYTRAAVNPLDLVPQSWVTARVWEIYTGRCPECSGPGPIDVHRSFRVWSVLIFTSPTTQLNVCCAACATRIRWKDMRFSLLCGWWGFPWGPISTPAQVVRNVLAIVRVEEKRSTPSEDLDLLVRLQLTAEGAPLSAPLFNPPR